LKTSTAELPDRGNENAGNKSVEDCLSSWCGLRIFDKNLGRDKSKRFCETTQYLCRILTHKVKKQQDACQISWQVRPVLFTRPENSLSVFRYFD